MNILMIFNHQPYDGTDVTWNALRLANKLVEKGVQLKIFLMNDAVDLARDAAKKLDFYEYDLVKMIKDLYDSGAGLKVCGTCVTRCGINKNQPYFDEKVNGTMEILTNWVIESDKVLTF